MKDVVQNLRVLMIYIEPAPYILDLIRGLREEHPQLKLHVLFITQIASQPWGDMPEIDGQELLPAGRRQALSRIRSAIGAGGLDWLHLAGWGHPLLKAALRYGKMAGLRISMESDSQNPFVESGWKRSLKALLYPRLFADVDLFFPGGSRQKRYLCGFGVRESKLRIAQMTVDVDRIIGMAEEIRERRAVILSTLGLAKAETLFVFVGRLEPYKGIELLLKAFANINVPNTGLLIVGDGSCRPIVEKAAANDHRVRYVGRRGFEGVVEALAVADVSVVPSSFEPWGLVVNEAMAAGLPVIASDRVGAVDDLVVENESGIVFPSGDILALMAAMRRLAEDATLRARLAGSGRRLISTWNLAASADIFHKGWCDAQ
jgi:glycosyltransferase involved in cell wall biosynthesis